MRLLCTFHDQRKAYILSNYLQQAGIDNQLEVVSNTDWGSPDYGTTTSSIWVTEEDHVETASQIMQEFEQDPENPRFYPKETGVSSLLEPIKQLKETPLGFKKSSLPQAESYGTGIVTLSLILICSIFLFIGAITAPEFVNDIPESIPYTAVFNSPLYKTLMFDYPQAYEWIDKFIKAYGIGGLQKINEVPPQGIELLKKYQTTPYWKGFYQVLVTHLQNPRRPWNFTGPLFEKIRQGQVWRLFTPCLLHYDIFHLFFNMIWLLVLGKQMEKKLGVPRYLFFILLTGILSNIAQYLTGGANFLGFSGVLCAMLTFMWQRQKIAAWEGYQLQPSTFGFIMVFIFAMFAVQLGSFVLEVYTKKALTAGIANTAHLSGALFGFILGKLDYFGIKNQ